MGVAQVFKNRGGVLESVHFLVKGPGGKLGSRRFTRLEDAWAAGSEVVVIDSYGHEHSLYSAYSRGMIYLKPILPKKRHRDPV